MIAKEEIDKLAAELDAAKAATVAMRARLELAKLNIEATQIIAPIAGRIGRRLVDEGNLVKGSDTLLATIVVANPLNVLFEIPECDLLPLVRKMREAKGAELAVEVHFAANEKELYSAKVELPGQQSRCGDRNDHRTGRVGKSEG